MRHIKRIVWVGLRVMRQGESPGLDPCETARGIMIGLGWLEEIEGAEGGNQGLEDCRYPFTFFRQITSSPLHAPRQGPSWAGE